MSNVIFEGGDYLDNLALNLKKQHPELSAITKEMIKLTSCQPLDGDVDHNTTATIAIDGFAGTVDVKYTRVNLSMIYQGFYNLEVPMTSDDDKVSKLEVFKAFCLSAGIPYHDGVIADPDGRVDISTVTDGTYPIITSCPYFIAENDVLKIRAVSKKVVDLATISINECQPLVDGSDVIQGSKQGSTFVQRTYDPSSGKRWFDAMFWAVDFGCVTKFIEGKADAGYLDIDHLGPVNEYLADVGLEPLRDITWNKLSYNARYKTCPPDVTANWIGNEALPRYLDPVLLDSVTISTESDKVQRTLHGMYDLSVSTGNNYALAAAAESTN